MPAHKIGVSDSKKFGFASEQGKSIYSCLRYRRHFLKPHTQTLIKTPSHYPLKPKFLFELFCKKCQKRKEKTKTMACHEEQYGSEELSLVHPDPVVLELNRLKDLLKGYFDSFSVF